MRPWQVSDAVRWIIFSGCVVAVTLCLFNAYILGKAEGLDAKLNYGAGNDVFAISIAISESLYGFNRGYVGRPEVEKAIKDILLPDDATEQQALAGNGAAIEAALQAATALDPSTFQPYKSTRAPFVIMPAEDTGLVDFYKLSFFLFGYHADSTYHCFFLLLSISCLLFLMQARGQPCFLVLLVVVLFSFNLLFYSDVFTGRADAPSVTSNRNLGILSIIATMHLMLFSRMQNRYARVSGWLMWITQAALLIFLMTVRSSTQWQWIAVLAWLATSLLWKGIRNWRNHPLGEAMLTTLRQRQHMLIALLALLGLQQLASNARLANHDDI